MRHRCLHMSRHVDAAGWRLLLSGLTQQRHGLVRLAAWSLPEALPVLLSGRLVALALDDGFLAGRAAEGFFWLGLLGVTGVVAAVGSRQAVPWLATVVEPVRDALVRFVVAGTLRRAVDGGDRPDARHVARLTRQTETVRQSLSGLLLTVRYFLVATVTALTGLITLAPAVGLIAVPPLLLALTLFAWLLRTLAPRQRALLLAEEKMAGSAGAAVAAVRDIVACGAARRAAATIGAAIDSEARDARALARTGALRTVVVALGARLPVLLTLLAAPWLIDSGQVSTGALLGAVTYLSASLEPALAAFVQTVGHTGLQLDAALRRIAEDTAVPPAPTPAPVRRGVTVPTRSDLQVRDLTFAYGPHAEPVVHALDLDVRPSEHLTVVGPSGIGKSTLVGLLTGLVPPQRGEVRIGGVPLIDIDEPWLRRAIAVVPQEAYVFAGTLRENLAYLHPDAADRELDDAVAAVGLRPLVERLGGYAARVGGNGRALSAGERQLVALARVYLSPARVVLLDEASCFLDPVSEARAEAAFSRRGGILVVVAHRIASAMRADRVLLMGDGRPLLGTHEDLLARSALYADLVGHWAAKPTVPTGVAPTNRREARREARVEQPVRDRLVAGARG